MAVNQNQRLKEKRQLKWRLAAFLILHGLIALHLILWYGFGWHGLGAIDMQELFRNLIEKNVVTVGAVFFLALIALGLIWGRLFCGWMCHIGQVYDLLAALFEKLKWKWGSFPLRLGPLVALFILLWYYLREAVVHRMQAESLPLDLAWNITEPWELLPGWFNGTLTLVTVLVVMPLIFGRRTFCRNLCPWGVLLGLTNRFSPWKVRRTGNCTMCGECSTACPMDIDVSAMINTQYKVQSVSCTNCFQCVASCPTDALSFSLPSRENRRPKKRKLLEPLQFVSWPVELTFWFLTLCFGLIYDQLYGIGIFLAYSLGMVVSWSSMWLWGSLKRLPKAVWVAPLLALSLIWLVVTKDGVANTHYYLANQAWNDGDFKAAQAHYETTDRLFWRTPNILLYRLYIIYKQTNQESKRKALYDRYERRRKAQGKI